MKFAIVLLVLLPLAFTANPLVDIFNQLKKDIHLDVLKENVNKIAAAIGTDATEAQCEVQCAKIATAEILSSGCPLFCKSFQFMANHFKIG
ncbi:hypothetical protein SNE40_022891 [Patella caerulea]|uniref:Uncharacterized protein n=1 Tax=Patella caerulea TaxID=87958 RepID=A0AAN8G1N6_PATCE